MKDGENMLGMIIKIKREEEGISQEALAKGICAVSYLSKIENEQVKSSEQIISALFNKLGIDYITDEITLNKFKEKFDDWYDKVVYEDDMGDIYSYDMYQLSNRMVNSRETVSALIYKLYYEVIKNKQVVDLKQIESFIYDMNNRQLILFTLLRAYNYHNQKLLPQALDSLKKALIYDNEGLIRCKIVLFSFYNGIYNDAIEEGKNCLRICAENGRLNAMHAIILLIAYSYSNLFDEENTFKYFDLSFKYSKYLKKPLYVEENYNIGTSYLMFGKYNIAKTYLEKSLLNTNDWEMTRQKIGFLYALLNEKEKAMEQVENLKKSKDYIFNKSAHIIELMVLYPDYITRKDYIQLLEDCFTKASEKNHHGYWQFFAILLKKAYVTNRMYKKALEITELFKFSSI